MRLGLGQAEPLDTADTAQRVIAVTVEPLAL